MKTCIILYALIGVIHDVTSSNPTVAEKNEPSTIQIQNPSETSTHQLHPKQTLQHSFENYEELGCFANTSPWRTFFRPFPPPKSPKIIDAKIYLYTRETPNKRFEVKLWKDISIDESNFDPQRSHTAFITHGFASNGNEPWMYELKNAYLKQRDANVFLVDWGKGANHWNYFQVAANTRVVGAELRRFVKYLVEAWHLDPARIHFMGHSLGAHISAYAAKGIPGVGHLTAFDPAQPGFEGSAAEVRLTKNDAKFVDVIHTNIRPAVPLLGFGLILPTGHVDYYMNGGAIQPGCITPPLPDYNLTNFEDIGEISLENAKKIIPMVQTYSKVISDWVACSHGKSYQYYIEALQNDFCTFWGRSTSFLGTIFDVATLGQAASIWDFNDCTLDECSPIGLNAEAYPARGSFSVCTADFSPYCKNFPKTTELMNKLMRQKLLQKPNNGKEAKEKEFWDYVKDVFKPYF